ncbi:MAG: type II secretion system F family protein [Candidatus Nanoarchaeia archaeon]|nr:type II secretion system F family protein [Candidatus Nanoarchaeia archaeon]
MGEFRNMKIAGFFIAALFVYIGFFVMSGTQVGSFFKAASLIFALGPFFYEKIVISQREKQMTESFVEFIRSLVSSVKSGMPIPQAIMFVSRDDFGVLSPYVKTMANKISWGISLTKCLESFAESTKISTIQKNIHVILQAEKSGGFIEDVLDNVTQTLRLNQRLRARRRMTIQAQIGQSYVIFVIFLVVLIIIKNYLLPYMIESGQENTGDDEMSISILGGSGADSSMKELFEDVKIDFTSPFALIMSVIKWLGSIQGVFMSLSLMQGFFSGLVLGQLAEGSPYAGLQHSFIMMSIGLIVLTIV